MKKDTNRKIPLSKKSNQTTQKTESEILVESIDFVRLGSIIREARINQQLTQDQLSEAIEVTPAFIGHIERGERSLSLVTLVKIAKRLNISMDFLFSDIEPSFDDKIIEDFRQLVEDRPLETKEAVLDIVRTALRHLK